MIGDSYTYTGLQLMHLSHTFSDIIAIYSIGVSIAYACTVMPVVTCQSE